MNNKKIDDKGATMEKTKSIKGEGKNEKII